MKQLFKIYLLIFAMIFLPTISVAASQSAIDATVFTTPRAIIPFKLTDNQGNTFTNKNLQGHWTFLFFGFTHCPMICPTTMALLNKVYTKLKTLNKASNVNVVLVSIDPQRDTVQRLNQYVHTFNKHFIGLTGSKAEIDKLSQQLGIVAMRIPGKTKAQNDYDINHSGAILLVAPSGKLIALFSMPHKADNIVADFLKIR